MSAQRSGRSRRVTVAATAAVAVVAAGVAFVVLRGGGGPATSAAHRTVATVARGTVTAEVAAAGTTQATQSRGLSFSASGTVATLTVKAGDSVTAGEVLASIEDAAVQIELDDAQTAVATAQDDLTQAEATEAASGTATASSATGLGSTAGGATNAGRAPSGQSGSGGDAVYAAQVALNNAKLAVSQAKQKLDGTVIIAPIAGRVLAVNGSAGADETPGSTAFITVGSVSDTQVEAEFSEADVATIAVGQPATITVANSTDTVAGTVSSVDPAGTATNSLVQYAVMVSFSTVPGDLLIGQSANVTVTTASVTGVLYVSSSAVTGIAGGTGTVVVRTGGRDEQRSVGVGLRGDRYTEITSGLSEGDQVVLSTS